MPSGASSSTPNQTTALVQTFSEFSEEQQPLGRGQQQQQSVIEVSEDSINSIEKVEEWKVLANGKQQNGGKRMHNGSTPSPRENG